MNNGLDWFPCLEDSQFVNLFQISMVSRCSLVSMCSALFTEHSTTIRSCSGLAMSCYAQQSNPTILCPLLQIRAPTLKTLGYGIIAFQECDVLTDPGTRV